MTIVFNTEVTDWFCGNTFWVLHFATFGLVSQPPVHRDQCILSSAEEGLF